MYALVETAGKQYRVAVGDRIMVDRLEADVDSEINLDRVLLVDDGKKVNVGAPTVEGASVQAKVLEHKRGKKVIIFKFRRRQRYRNRRGFRSSLTTLEITGITA